MSEVQRKEEATMTTQSQAAVRERAPERLWVHDPIEHGRTTAYISPARYIPSGQPIETYIEYVRADLIQQPVSSERSCLNYAEMIESQNDVSAPVENWSDFHRGQVYAAKQLAASFADTGAREGEQRAIASVAAFRERMENELSYQHWTYAERITLERAFKWFSQYAAFSPAPVDEGEPHEHRWVGRGEYSDTSSGYMCGDCGVDLDDTPEPPSTVTTSEPAIEAALAVAVHLDRTTPLTLGQPGIDELAAIISKYIPDAGEVERLKSELTAAQKHAEHTMTIHKHRLQEVRDDARANAVRECAEAVKAEVGGYCSTENGSAAKAEILAALQSLIDKKEREGEGEKMRITHDGRPLLVALTLGPRQTIGFSVPASNDDIVRSRPHELLEQLELLCTRLRDCEYPFSFLKEQGDGN